MPICQVFSTGYDPAILKYFIDREVILILTKMPLF